MMPAVTLPFDYSGFKTLLLAAVLPPAPMLLLAAWGGWRMSRQRRGGGWLLAVALLGVWFSATEAAGELLSRALGQPALLHPAHVDALKPLPHGAVLVLGGGVRRHVPEFGTGALNDITGERLAYGAWVARRTGWPLAFSGGIGWTATRLRQSEASIAARVAWEDHGLKLRWAEDRARDTRENAANTLPMLARSGVTQVVLVTHDAHMRRAMRAFEAVAGPLGVRVIPAPVGLRNDALGSFDDWCPSAAGFARVRYLVYEQLAWWAGR